jgi:hypothetical protein
MTGRIGTEFGVRAPIRVRQVRRHRIACTGADDFGDRGLRQRLRLALRLATADLVRPRSAMVLVGLTAGGTDLLQTIPGMAWGWRFGLLAVGYVAAAAIMVGATS